MRDLHVIVVGAGIGGLQTSLALAKDGHRVTVLESAKAFEEVRIHYSLTLPYIKRGQSIAISPDFYCFYNSSFTHLQSRDLE